MSNDTTYHDYEPEDIPNWPRHVARRKIPSLDTIVNIQKKLNDAGFDSGPEDNINGPLTKNAVRLFQQYCKDNCGGTDQRIIDPGPVDGIWGPKTEKALKYFFFAFL